LINWQSDYCKRRARQLSLLHW